MAIKLTDEGVLEFRHPLVLDKKGYGKFTRAGVGKEPRAVQLAVQAGLERLLELRPKVRTDLKENVNDRALKIWFKPLSKPFYDNYRFSHVRLSRQIEKKALEQEIERSHIELDPSAWNEQTMRFVESLIFRRIKVLEIELNKQAEETSALKLQLEGISRATGEKTGEKKVLTLGACQKWYEQNSKSVSAQALKKKFFRVGKFISAAGVDTLYSDLTKKIIETVISGINGSASEKFKILVMVKNFFVECSADEASGGLGLNNPASTLVCRRPENGRVLLTSPSQLFELGFDAYDKALIAVLGYGGLRLAEAAALTWDQIDEENNLIHVCPNDLYPKLKSVLSYRPVKPFPNVWKFLKEHKKFARNDRIIFDRFGDNGPSWFEMVDDLPGVPQLSASLRNKILHRIDKAETDTRLVTALEDNDDEALEAALTFCDLNAEPARRLRHYFHTTMKQHGYAPFLKYMGGNTESVSDRNYTDALTALSKANIKAL